VGLFRSRKRLYWEGTYDDLGLYLIPVAGKLGIEVSRIERRRDDALAPIASGEFIRHKDVALYDAWVSVVHQRGEKQRTHELALTVEFLSAFLAAEGAVFERVEIDGGDIGPRRRRINDSRFAIATGFGGVQESWDEEPREIEVPYRAPVRTYESEWVSGRVPRTFVPNWRS
jgi:hypothetical protein